LAEKYDIVGIGVPYLDLVVQLEQVPGVNQTAPIAGYKFTGGGKVPTALVAASRLGLRTTLIAGIADDSFGRTIREELVHEGVSLAHAVATESSALSVVLADRRTKSRTILYGTGEVPEVDVFADPNGIAAGLLHISSAGPAEHAGMNWAHNHNVPVMLDADYYDPAFEGLASNVALWIGSEHYFTGFKPDLNLEQKMSLLYEAGPKVVIATLGEKGCIVLDEGGFQAIPAFVVEVVDTTGAGDVFHGAYAYAYLQGWPSGECATFASAVAAMKCRKSGGREGIPRLEEVNLFLKNYNRELTTN